MPKGKVIFWDRKKGYGFVTADDGGGDLLLHHSATELPYQDHPEVGQEVEYEVAVRRQGRAAVKARLAAIESGFVPDGKWWPCRIQFFKADRHFGFCWVTGYNEGPLPPGLEKPTAFFHEDVLDGVGPEHLYDGAQGFECTFKQTPRGIAVAQLRWANREGVGAGARLAVTVEDFLNRPDEDDGDGDGGDGDDDD